MKDLDYLAHPFSLCFFFCNLHMHVDSTLLESEIRRGVNYQKQQVRNKINT